MHPLVKKFEEKQRQALKHITLKDNFRVGDKLRLKLSVIEKDKKWVQTSEGICISKVNRGISSSFTIRRVEKNCSILMKFLYITEGLSVEILSRGKVRRAKLYYLERCSTKAGRLKSLSHNQMKKLALRENDSNIIDNEGKE